MVKSYSQPASVWALFLYALILTSSSSPAQAAARPESNDSSPEFSVPGGIYSRNLSVRITAGGRPIHYTLDGSEPTEKSHLYSDPVKVSASTIIRARVLQQGASAGPIVSQAYTLVEADVAGFDSNLPLVIINTFGHRLERENKTAAAMTVVAPTDGRTSLGAKPDFTGLASVNIRGNTSLRYPKRSLHLKTRSGSGDPLKTSILGFPKESDWILYAPYPDKTLMRDVLAYELSNKMGQYAPRTKFVEVFVSYSEKVSMDDYMGVYVFEEKIKRAKERVHIAKLGPEDSKEPEISGGYIFKKDHLDRSGGMMMPTEQGVPERRGSSSIRFGFPTGPGGFPGKAEGFENPYGGSMFPTEQLRRLSGSKGLNRRQISPRNQDTVEMPFIPGFNDESIPRSLGFGTPRGNQFFYVEPKGSEMTSAQKTWLKRYVDGFESALYGPNFRDPTNGYAAFIDVDSFIDHHWLVEATKNVDGFRFSTFYYKDRADKIHMGPIWDWNLAFGNVNGKQGWMPQYWYWPQLDDHQYTWFRRLFQDPDFGQKLVDRWAVLRTNVFATSNIFARIDELATLLNEAQARNFQRWRILGRPVWPNHFVGSSYEEEVLWLKNYIETRLGWIDDQFVPSPTPSLKPGKVPAEAALTLGPPPDKLRTIYYTLDGTDPRASGGTPSPTAKIYDGPVTLTGQAHLFARAKEKNLWSSPTMADFRVEQKRTHN